MEVPNAKALLVIMQGRTKRKLATRLNEHSAPLRNCDTKTALVTPHCVDTGHTICLSETKILTYVTQYATRLLMDPWFSNYLYSASDN